MSSRKVKKAEIFENKFLNIAYEDGTLCQIDLERLFDVEFIKEKKISKELKSFDRIKNYQILVNVEKDEVKTISELLPSSCNEVETALKELEYLKEVKNMDDFYKKNNAIIDYELIGKKLKAFEIIKKKGLSVNDIAFIRNKESWETYIETMKQLYYGDEHLDKVLKTQEEYDLLKEVLL